MPQTDVAPPATQTSREAERFQSFVEHGSPLETRPVAPIEASTPARRPWRVAAVIPGFGKHKDVELLLRDLSRLDLRGIELWAVLVDNATPVPLSTVPVPANLRLEHHRMSENTGGAGGFNAGMSRVLAGEGLSGEFDPPDFIWCLDSDARVIRSTLRVAAITHLRQRNARANGYRWRHR